jgi:hypothetical protein
VVFIIIAIKTGRQLGSANSNPTLEMLNMENLLFVKAMIPGMLSKLGADIAAPFY